MYKEKLPPNFNYNERKKLLFVLYTKTVGQKKSRFKNYYSTQIQKLTIN